ncbi:cupin domain-containing protein [Devosia sp. YIM 151766]|uniref:cupin domain-containing protein n=1 Tax=Devosia sp. YIM 151766 TaxID=3017325 RepID=UPI00255CB552|nr:cupin domain-containing protein [Devosia sp. YIM 151766]WIY53385.1 cupin domain-containing protein [Devosia sp. YIM 151766]
MAEARSSVRHRQEIADMVHIVPAADKKPGDSRTIRFEGADFGAPIAFFAVDAAPGQGPKLHLHPYAETWIVKRGRARVVAGDEAFELGPDDIAVMPANTPHKFTALEPERLEMVCIHAAGTMRQDNLE